jgi:hypothetical protein
VQVAQQALSADDTNGDTPGVNKRQTEQVVLDRQVDNIRQRRTATESSAIVRNSTFSLAFTGGSRSARQITAKSGRSLSFLAKKMGYPE